MLCIFRCSDLLRFCSHFISCWTIIGWSFGWVSGWLKHSFKCSCPRKSATCIFKILHCTTPSLAKRSEAFSVLFLTATLHLELAANNLNEFQTVLWSYCSPKQSRQQLASVYKDAGMQRICLHWKSTDICRYDTISWLSSPDVFWCFYLYSVLDFAHVKSALYSKLLKMNDEFIQVSNTLL